MNYPDRDDWIDNAPDDARGRLVHLVRRLAFAYSDRVSRSAAQLGLHPTDLRALALVLDAGRSREPLTVGALGATLRMNQPTVTAIVDRLVDHTLVERRPVPGDRRKVALAITEKGRQTGWSAFGSLVQDMHSQLSDVPTHDLETAEIVLGLALTAFEDVL
ncbi:MarR family transcriptional regulator [Gordonia sp. CPCC 206044]|uniref:MarR family winged helix-turn-helix transcriptional regulator n=1 Tax=Gordonia sp. CPCC 206044 TaxID=3140793 RepID=UPI003AF35A49